MTINPTAKTLTTPIVADYSLPVAAERWPIRAALSSFVFALIMMCWLTSTAPVHAQAEVPWAQSSLGSITGSFATDTVFEIAGCGSLSGTADSFSFARIFTATVVDLKAEVTAPGAGFAGIMIRRSTAANNAHISVGLTSGNAVQLIYRTTDGGSTTTTTGATTGGATLVRILQTATSATDETFQAMYSTDGGSNYTNIGSPITITSTNWYQGLTVVSGTGSLTQTKLSKCSLTAAQMDAEGFQIEDIGSPTVAGQLFFDYQYIGAGVGEGVLNSGAADSVNFCLSNGVRGCGTDCARGKHDWY